MLLLQQYNPQQRKKLKKILTDVDGVLLNWEWAFHCWMETKGHVVRVEDKGLFWNIDAQYNIHEDHALSLVAEFNNSAAIGFLPPLRDAHEVVRKLHYENGYIFHAVTSLSSDEYAIRLRKMNLDKIFGKEVFEHVECLPLLTNKGQYLSKFAGTGYYWLEDHIDNAVAGLQHGLKPILMEHGYSMHYDHADIRRVKDWSEIYDIVTSESFV